MEIKRQYRIVKMSCPDAMYGYNYSAEVDISVDGGKTYWHCGIGKYTKTYEEAEEYCKNYELTHKEVN